MTKKEIIEKINEFIEWIPDDGDFNFIGFSIHDGNNLYRSYSIRLLNPKHTRQVRETLDKNGDLIDSSIEAHKIRDFEEG